MNLLKYLFIVFLGILIFYSPSFAQKIYADISDTSCGFVWGPIWQFSKDSVNVGSPRKIAISGDTIHITWDDGLIKLPYVRSTNGGVSFEPVRELLLDTTVFRLPASSNHILSYGSNVYIIFSSRITAGYDPPVKMIKSTDGGTSWLLPKHTIPDTTAGPKSVALNNDTLVFCVNPLNKENDFETQIWISTNGGDTWYKLSRLIPQSTSLALSPGKFHMSDDASAAPIREVIYRNSYDLGETWSDSLMLSTYDGISSISTIIAVTPLNNNVAVVWREPKDGCTSMVDCHISIRVSKDGGLSFSPEIYLTNQPTGRGARVSMFGDLIAAAWVDYNYPVNKYTIHTRISKNGGDTWCPEFDVNPCLWGSTYVAVGVSSNTVHVIWRQQFYPLLQYAILYRSGRLLPNSVKENKIKPSEFTLYDNYPNPFNSSTIIKYQIAEKCNVKIKVYNILGREIATLVDEVKMSGEYSVNFNSDNLPSGIYIIRLTDGKFSSSQKAILIK